MFDVGPIAKRLALIAVVCAFATLAHAGSNPACAVPPDAIGDGWPLAAPDSVGLDGDLLCEMAGRLKYDESDVHAVVVIRHGKLVFEQYFDGYDEPWGGPSGRTEFDATAKHDMRSVTKSMVSLLIGIAIDRKLINGLDEPVLKFFPEVSRHETGWDAVTLRHLLTMSSGMVWDENRRWNDPENDEPHLGKDADPLHYVLAKPVLVTPGTLWNYNGGGIDLLGNIIERLSGKSLADFAREVLFAPLGISDFEWKSYENGKISAAAGLRLRPRDAAKIGQLVLNHGLWDGKQVISADWIAQSITPRFQATSYFGGLFYYGYSWWMGRTLTASTEVKWIAGIGLGGQRLIIVPDLDIVMMYTAGLYTSPRQGLGALDILNDFVIAAVRDKQEAN